MRLKPHHLALLLPSVLTTLAAAQTTNSAATYLAGSLVNDARDALRNPDLPPDAAATQAAILLESAAKLDATDLTTLRLLAQSAQAAGRTTAQRDALRKIIAQDTGDLVAQVQYIELLANASQNAEDRMAVYRGAFAQAELDAQVRSELAVRLARLAESRGDAASCRDYLAQAVKLNNVNVGALRDLVRLAAAEPPGNDAFNHHLQALSALLVANAYQPDAWLQAARICQAANVHDRAAEFLTTAAEQFNIDGTPVSGDLFLDLALECAIGGQRSTAYELANNLSQLPDAPLGLLLVAELLAPDKKPSASPATASQPAVTRADVIHSRLVEMAKATDNPAALADAAGADLTVFPTPGAATPAWIEAYAKLVKPEDPTLIRLQGWLLFRQNKLDAAQTLLQNATDPLARVGLARVLIAQGKTPAATAILQDLWNGNPTGLLALQITLAASQASFKLADSASARQVRPLIARLTPGLSAMHRRPLESQLIQLNFRKAAVGPGEPGLLQISITNTTDRAQPVGAEGVVKSTVGLAASARGANRAALGLYAVENLQRVYRLEPRHALVATVRVDQGRLADLFEQDPAGTYIATVTLITAPRVLSPAEFSAGIGGQAIGAGDIQHSGLSLAKPDELQRLRDELATLTGERQLLRITAAGTLLPQKPDAQLAAPLASLAKSPDPLVRATLLRAAPATAPVALASALAAADNDPLVRLLWARHQSQIAALGGTPAPAALAALEKQSATEKDPLVKDYLASLLPLAKEAATRPAAPTTAPTTSTKP